MNPIDLSALPFPGGPVDASAFQPLAGPTSRSVPWTDPLVDVVFPALAIASRAAVLVEREFTIRRDEQIAAADARDYAWLLTLDEELADVWEELEDLLGENGASTAAYLRSEL